MALLKKFEKSFGKTKVPPILKDFIAFAEKQDGFFAGDFELDPSNKAIISTYKRYDKKKKEQFYFFGNNADGSGFAIWHYDSKAALEDSPITFWDSEGQVNIVIALNFKEFLSILATDGSFSSGSFIELEKDEDPSPQNKTFKKWLKEKYKFNPAKDSNQLIVKARKAFPDIEDWFKGKADAFVKPSNEKMEIVKAFTSWDNYFKKYPEWFNIIGKSINEYLPVDKMKVSSYDKETLYYQVPSEGIEVYASTKGVIRTIRLTIIKEDAKIYKGSLPNPLTREITKKEVLNLFGKPTKQDKTLGWIRYDKLRSYVLHMRFGKDERIKTISLMDPVTAP